MVRRDGTRADPSRCPFGDYPQDLAHRNGLHQQLVASGGETTLARRIVIVSAHRQLYGGMHSPQLQLAENPQSILIRESQIEKHDRRRQCRAGFDRIGRCSSDRYFVSVCLEENPQCAGNELTILDDKNADGHYSGASVQGSVKKKRLPRPSSLSTQMRPPCSSTNRRAMVRPRPIP